MERCIYCGYSLGDTKEHIIPRSLLTDLRIFTHRQIDAPTDNIAPCCSICNKTKGHRVFMPTPGNMIEAYVNTPSKYIQSIAEWVAWYEDELLDFFEKEANRDNYKVELDEIRTTVVLYNNDYYELLSDRRRNIPNNPFKRQFISLD